MENMGFTCLELLLKTGGLGVSPTGKSFRFVSFVRACARSAWQVEFDRKRGCDVFPFAFCCFELSLFTCVSAEVIPFPFVGRSEIKVESM